MRKYLLISLLVVAIVLGGCSDPYATTEPTAAPTATTAAEATAEPTDEVTDGLSGTLTLAGSTTVQPLAEVLAEAFMAINPDVVIEIQGGGSGVGVTSVAEGTVDIGNASRAVKSSEQEQYPDLETTTIAYDGIAIVVNPDVELPSLSLEQIRGIFSGEITNFSEVGGPDAEITVISREEGSGTRDAFTELVMSYKDAAGESQEALITEDALLQQSNGQVRTAVSTTPNSIAFLSFGFLDDSITGVAVNDVEPTVANVKNGSYPIYRPLNMLTMGEPSELAAAFLDYILGDAGQAIVAEDYITVTDEEEPVAALSGTLTLAGSTTVQPLAEVLAEAFMAINPDVVIEIQGGGSGVGVTSVAEGTVDIGNASRAVKSSEQEQYPDLETTTIAYDGIAIVVNPDVELPSLSLEQIRGIFSGEITNFSEVGGPDAEITVISREEGSGTRDAFTELVMSYKDAAGESQEALITEDALLQQSNGQVRTAVSTTPNSIAFLSFGFLDDSITGVAVNDVEPTVANVKNGSYPIYRPLNMLTMGEPSELAAAFMDYILGDAGQAIVAEDYITVQ